MKKFLHFCFISASLLLYENSSNAQVSIGVPASDIHPSAQLDVSSASKGLLPPRMTEVQRNAIATPAAGLMLWCSNCGTSGEVQVYNGSAWTNMVGGAASAGPDLTPRVAIGTQVWTTQNLNVATYRDGTPIPKVANATDWAALTTGAWCWYNNDSTTYASTYGRLYNWYAFAGIWNEASKTDVAQRKQLAPTGYHIPSYEEWTTLETSLGGGAELGGAMKETGTTHWMSPNTSATNSSAFTGLPGGYRNNAGLYTNVTRAGFWWTSREELAPQAFYRGLFRDNGSLSLNSSFKLNGFSVRCIKD